MKITELKGREVFDSRGNPTVEVELWSGYLYARAIAPSGASTGSNEAIEIRDADSKFYGKGVSKALKNLEEVSVHLIGREFSAEEIDQLLIDLDGTSNKSKLGTNVTTPLSMAAHRLYARSKSKRLWELFGGRKMPRPMMNIINGGKHAGDSLAIQEFMVVPKAKTFSEMMSIGVQIYLTLKHKLKEKFGKRAINVGDEGGFVPPINTAREAFDIIQGAVDEIGSADLAIDAAANEFYKNGFYEVDGKKLTKEELLDYYIDLSKTYNLYSIEDPFFEQDFEGYAELNKKVRVIGDDLTTTNVALLEKAITKKSISGIIIKINQVGTVKEALQTIRLAKQHHLEVIISHRSGEAEDPFISHFAVGTEAHFIKAGAPARERNVKYNELLRIEELL